MKKLIIILLLFSTNLYGQNDSIKKAILNQAETKSVIISKGRTLLLDKFVKGDYESVKKIIKYLDDETKESGYTAFYPAERWLLLYWTENYNEIIKDASNFDKDSFLADFQSKIKPAYDLLPSAVVNKTANSTGILETYIKNSKLNQMDKDFLTMHLNSLLVGVKGYKNDQNIINDMTDVFLQKYPKSKYENFVRAIIRDKMIPSDWALAYEFFSGYGKFTDDLDKHFSKNIPIGIAFDVSYKKWNLYLRDYIGFSKTRYDIPYKSTTWGKGKQANIFIPEISLGYTVLDNKLVKMSPFAGFSGLGISSVKNDIEKNSKLEDVERWTTTYVLGLNFDFKIKNVKSRYNNGYLYIRLRYSYALPNFDKKYNNYGGNVHFITIGIGQLGRFMKRD